MKRISLYLLLALFSLSVFAQKDAQAKNVLDKTSATLSKSGGIKAQFSIKTTNKAGANVGQTSGSIQLKGNKFLLKTDGTTTWFDGKTQWSYVNGSEEVNVSNPDNDELQSMNPYALLYMYKSGFNYKYKGAKSVGGKQIYDILLTPEKKTNINQIELFIAKNNYQPVRIIVTQKDKSKSEVIVSNYTSGQSYNDSLFKFDKKKYPKAEIIDLR